MTIMLKKLLSGLCILAITSPALAANQKPTNVPTPSGPTVATYAAGTTKNVLGNGSATAPDTPPYFTSGNMPADIPTPNRTNWTTITDGTASYATCSANPLDSCELKQRLQLNDSHVGYDDPLRNFNEPGTSHCHDFAGNAQTNSRSMYHTLRSKSESYTQGGRLNATAYWFPCAILTNPFGDTPAKNYVLRIDVVGVYYKADHSIQNWLTPLPPGLGYVFGTNMDDPQDTTRKREVIVANAQPGTAGRYAYRGNGFVGISCLADSNGSGALVELTGAQTANGSNYQPYLNSIDGQTIADPWLGNCKTNPTSGAKATLLFEIQGADCWNGIDPWVPGDYNHVRMSIADSQLDSGHVQYSCPNHWYHLPQLEEKVQYTVTGWSDYSRIRFASDDAMESKLNSLPVCTTDATGNYSNAPCAEHTGPLWNSGLGRFKVPNGASFHADWMMGWDGLTLKLWEAHCMGIGNLYDGDGNIMSTAGTLIDNSPHTCEPLVLIPNGTSTTFAIGSNPPTNDPQGVTHGPLIVDQSNGRLDSSSPANMFRVRTVNPSGMGSGKMCMGSPTC